MQTREMRLGQLTGGGRDWWEHESHRSIKRGGRQREEGRAVGSV